MIVRVIPLTRTRAVSGLFDYVVPDNLAGGPLAAGSLLRVPFAGREVTAVVAELADSSELPLDRLASIDSVLDHSLPADLVKLADWIAAEYCSTPARALSLLLPPGLGRIGHKRTLLATATQTGVDALSDGSRLTTTQRAALEQLRDTERPAAEVGTQLLRRLEARGLVTLTETLTRRRPTRHTVSETLASPPDLTPEQEVALRQIFSVLPDSPSDRTEKILMEGNRLAPGSASRELLLHGVTGSGKTEVYLRAAEAVVAAGRGAIILVPEIGLTPQALARFEARLGDVVAVLHSGMSEGARHDEWARLRSGEARVCVGPRSAVFAPIADLGLIVVDEEHESSYKHEGDPRYDARTVARRRVAQHGAALIVGSATPRPESAFEFETLRLQRRVDGGSLPEVEVIDMRGHHHPLHPDVRMALADCRHEHGKAIVLLNRRGWSNFLSCASCGRVWSCPNCEVALVLHRASWTVTCHHCGHAERVPDTCLDCGSVSVSRHGAGTERLEHELVEALGAPDFPVFRLDADATGIDARARVLAAFHAAAGGVLVGTQMIAKGHDFVDVSLGVVVDADQTLRFPDFRAEERTFALVTQLAGRAGRGGAGESRGRVLVQTRAPNARSIRLAAAHDSDTFVRGELRRRKALGYPPFATLVRIVCSAPEPDVAHRAASALHAALDLPDAVVLGPASLFMLRRRARAQLLVKSPVREPAIEAVRDAVGELVGTKLGREVAISVDVDPQ